MTFSNTRLSVSAVQVEVTRYTVRLPVAVQQDCTGTLPTVPAALKTRTAHRTLLPAPPAPRILCPSLVSNLLTIKYQLNHYLPIQTLAPNLVVFTEDKSID